VSKTSTSSVSLRVLPAFLRPEDAEDLITFKVLLNPKNMLFCMRSSFASEEDLGFKSIMSRPVDVIVFRLNELVDREGLSYESGLEGVTRKEQELSIRRMALDDCTDFLVEMGN